jgi:HSP20 family protein
MRYRRMGYRYAMVLASQPRPLGDQWRVGRVNVVVAQTAWRPATDVYETPDTVAVTLELAGVDQDEVEIVLFVDAVVVQGQRKIPPVSAGGVYHSAEIRQGSFRAEVMLPAAVDGQRAEARFDQGLLRITLPKVSRE